MITCPACDCANILTVEDITHLPYGAHPESVLLVFIRPLRVCARCKLTFTDEAGERAQERALQRYRTLLYSPPPDIKAWCEKNAHMLEHLSLFDALKAWEEHRKRSVTA